MIGDGNNEDDDYEFKDKRVKVEWLFIRDFFFIVIFSVFLVLFL